MKLRDIISSLGLSHLTPEDTVDGNLEIDRGYASDLLSDVLANAPEKGVWVTIQVHLNVVAVASHAAVSVVIFASEAMPDEEVIERAAQEGIALLSSALDTFEIVGRLYQAGIRGTKG